jgi:hypothetical protein
MNKPNYQRMMALIDQVFATRKDPDQLQVTNSQLKKLKAIHPNTLTEYANDDGPLIWVLLIPTTKTVMDDFIKARISEKQLLDSTPVGGNYQSIYLCSVTALPEVRGKGLTKKLCLDAIRSIKKDHAVTTLFVWPFTAGGNKLAESLAAESGMVLFKREG